MKEFRIGARCQKPEFKSSDKLGDPDQSHQLVCEEHTDNATHVCVMSTLIKLFTWVTLNEKHTGQSPAWREGRELWLWAINIGPVLAAVTGLASQ